MASIFERVEVTFYANGPRRPILTKMIYGMSQKEASTPEGVAYIDDIVARHRLEDEVCGFTVGTPTYDLPGNTVKHVVSKAKEYEFV